MAKQLNLLLLLISPAGWALTTLEVIESASILKRDCYGYCIIGTCFWMKCGALGCSFSSSVKVKHRNPEVVIAVYPQPGDNPWDEMKLLYGSTVKTLQTLATQLDPTIANVTPGSGPQTARLGGDTHGVNFFEAQAVGHPLASAGAAVFGGLSCPAAADPWVLYFSSEVDANAWRGPLLESLYLPAILPGFREVGEHAPLQIWGGVFPRTGFHQQMDTVKGAAMIAQRAANIISQDAQPHIYIPLTDNGYDKTWQPGEVKENDIDNHAFQMLHPKKDEACYVFGENDVLTKSWSHGRRSDDDRYAFTLWRPYECCEQQGRFIGEIESTGVCL